MDLFNLIHCFTQNGTPSHSNIQLDLSNLHQVEERINACSCFKNKATEIEALKIAKQVMQQRRTTVSTLQQRLATSNLSSGMFGAVAIQIEALYRVQCPTQPVDESYHSWKQECEEKSNIENDKINQLFDNAKKQLWSNLKKFDQNTISLREGVKIHSLGTVDDQSIIFLTHPQATQSTASLWWLNNRNQIFTYAEVKQFTAFPQVTVLHNQEVAISGNNSIAVYTAGCWQQSLHFSTAITTFCYDPFMSKESDRSVIWTARVDGYVQFDRLKFCGSQYNLNQLICKMATNQDYLLTALYGSGVMIWDKNREVTAVSTIPIKSQVSTIAPHPTDPTQFLAGELTGRLLLWDVRKSAKSVKTLIKNENEPVIHRLIWDRFRILSGDKYGVKAWDLRNTKKPIWTIDHPEVDFCVQDSKLIQGSAFGKIFFTTLMHSDP